MEQIGWSIEDKLLYQIKREIKKGNGIIAAITTTTTTTP